MIYNKTKVNATHTKDLPSTTSGSTLGSNAGKPKGAIQSTSSIPLSGNPSGWTTTTKIVVAALIALAVISICISIAYPSAIAALFSWGAAPIFVIGAVVTLLAIAAMAYIFTQQASKNPENTIKNDAKSGSKIEAKSSAKDATGNEAGQTNPVHSFPSKNQTTKKEATSVGASSQKEASTQEAELQAAEDRLRKAELAKALAYKDLTNSKKNDPQAGMIEELKLRLKETHPDLNTADIKEVRRAADQEVVVAKEALHDLIAKFKQSK